MNSPITLFRWYFVLPFIILAHGCANHPSTVIQGINHVSRVAFVAPTDTASLPKSEKNDLASLRMVFEVSGIRVKELKIDQISEAALSETDIVVIPNSSAKALSNDAIQTIIASVKAGKSLFTDGVSPVTSSIGIKYASPITISQIRDTHFSTNILYWTNPVNVRTIDNTIRKDTVLSYDETSRQILAVSGSLGQGRFITISSLFDPNTSKGYSQYPFLIEWFESYLGLKRIAERQAVEMYFDPGNRHDSPVSVDTLAMQWRDRKIKRIYAAGWSMDDAYDYAPLFKACHNNGIQVYCWLETPEVSQTIWDEHPEWREKTATGRDANIDWRKLMNLADSNCRKEVFKQLDEFLNKYDWDGVNFAEMYFEPHPAGFENPRNFTPMNRVVRNEFKNIEGFDPILLFDLKSPYYWKTNKVAWRKFADYRKELSFRIKSQFLDFLTGIKKQKGDMDIMFTGIDVSLQPAESDNIGESTEHTLELYKKYDITLQIEDPSNCWGSGPERYFQLGNLYRQTVKNPNRLTFDCNVVGSHEKGFGGFPSEKPSGEEIRQITYNMSLNNIRPAYYSEDAFYLHDFKNISTVLAREANITEESSNVWNIKTPYTISLKLGRKLGLKLDNQTWFACNGDEVIIPQGDHTLTFDTLAKKSNAFQLIHLSAELKSAKFGDKNLEFTYSEEVNSCYAIVDKKPTNIYIDGKKTTNLPTFGKGEFVVKLPSGEHRVKME